MKYKISIIIPIYNSEEFLEDTIKNVINQSIGFENIELFLIDDCSKDKSREIIKKYCEKYENIKPIFLKENSGHPSYPRNIALEKVTSPFIIFLDSDDRLFDDYCEVMYNLISTNDVDIVNCNHTSKLNDKLYIPQDISSIDFTTKTYADDERLLVLNHTVWGNIYRTSFFRENNIKFLHILFEDVVFSVYCLIKTQKEVIYLPNYPGYIYFIENDTSVTHDISVKTLNDFLKMIELIYNLLRQNCSKKTKINLLNDLMNMVFFILFKLEYKSEGIEILYGFENKLDFTLTPLPLPFNILNKIIMKKQFKLALILAKVMSILYNNKKIRNFLFIKYSGVKLINSE